MEFQRSVLGLGIVLFAAAPVASGCGRTDTEMSEESTVSVKSSLLSQSSDGDQDDRHDSSAGSISGPAPFGTIDLTAIGAGACTGPKAAQIWTLTNRHGLVAKLTD